MLYNYGIEVLRLFSRLREAAPNLLFAGRNEGFFGPEGASGPQ
jgi:hypothetical protein